MTEEQRLDKNHRIREKGKHTREKRKSQVYLAYRVKIDVNGFTALIYAAYCRCKYTWDIIEYLIEHGEDAQIYNTIKNGWKTVNFLKIRPNQSKERVRSLLQ